MISSVEHEIRFITPGPGHGDVNLFSYKDQLDQTKMFGFLFEMLIRQCACKVKESQVKTGLTRPMLLRSLLAATFVVCNNTFANSFVPDQDQQNVGSDLDINPFAL